MIHGNMVGAYSSLGKTFVFTSDDGKEFAGVVVEKEEVFDAKPSDVRINKTFVSSDGVMTGENTITYRTTQSNRLVLQGEDFSIPLAQNDKWNYTKFQCVIAPYNTSINDSTAVDKVVLFDNVYTTGSTTSLASVTKNEATKSIDLNITNDTDNIYIIHFTTYKEEEI